jgi:VWFA-related protein
MRPFVHGLISVICLLSLAAPAFADGDFNVTVQVDASGFPIFSLYVTVTDAAGKPVTGLTKDNFTVTEDGQPVAIDDFAGIGDPRPVDIVFVFDVTGSMQDKIDGVKATCVRFADQLNSSGRDYRLGLVTFLDRVDATYARDGSLTADVQEFKSWVGGLRADGGDDGPELSLDALLRAAKMKFRGNSQRILLLITDAPPHHRDDKAGFSQLTFDQTIEQLQRDNATVYVVGPNIAELPEADDTSLGQPGRYGLPARNEYERLAKERGGKFYDIVRNSDFTGLIDDIGTVIASQYRLTYRTLRPVPDGTLRGIDVVVSREGLSGGGKGAVLEPHLLNIQSNALVGLLMLALLGGTAAAPLLLRKRSIPAPGGAFAPPVQSSVAPPVQARPAPTWTPPTPPPASTVQVTPAAPAASAATCWRCGKPLRPGARFCGSCRAAQPQATPPVVKTASPICPQCGNALKPGAKFCNRCGRRLRN